VRGFHPARREVKVGGVTFGGLSVPIIAGPCSVDDPQRLSRVADGVRAAGASLLRAGVTKARTSPFGFQGRGTGALPLLSEVGRARGLPVVSEVLSTDDLPAFCEHVDLLQVGARNMHNTPLLRAIGRCGRPVLLKRGFGSTVDELLFAADTILAEGNQDVILCERGIRTFEGGVRFSFDLSALALLLERTRLPVVVDPSHAAGRASLVPAIARAAIAAGADGLLIEVHDRPAEALSDKEQALDLDAFGALTRQLGAITEAVGRTLTPPSPRAG
jgi:3-deoxy-7-phosphoheptulonate synthase